MNLCKYNVALVNFCANVLCSFAIVFVMLMMCVVLS